MRGLAISSDHFSDVLPPVTGLHDLRTKAKILHRDISLSNLMCKRSNDSKSVTLILNDFDLAAYVGEDGLPIKTNLSEHRTGTLPFMAIDVLQHLTTNTHYLRHDLESVFWVALWCLVKLPRSNDKTEEDRRRAILLNWEEGELKAICATKSMIIQNMEVFSALEFTSEMHGYAQWISAFRDVIQEGYNLIEKQRKAAKAAKVASDILGGSNLRQLRRTGRTLEAPTLSLGKVDEETLGGTISCDIIMDVLEDWESVCGSAIAD